MLPRTVRRYIGLAAACAAAAAQADTAAPTPDTSSWTCTLCPFFKGYTGEVEAGATYVSGANASYGRYTGVDHDGAYGAVGADGQWAGTDGTFANYDLQNLGLPSRDGSIEAGQQGRYSIRLDYDGQPFRLYDTTQTPFLGAGTNVLSLPKNWQVANSTGGMTQLNADLRPIDIGSDRRTVSVLGKFYPGAAWMVYGQFSHEEQVGTGVTSGSFLTEAVQLPEPINYSTNSVEAGTAWAGRMVSVHLAYTGSWFTDNEDSLTWSNPFTPIVSAGTLGRMALPPSNNLQQFSASGVVRIPIWAATTLTYNASVGELSQNAAFLPVSRLPGAATLAEDSLDGEVHISHYSLGLASRPLSKLYIRGTATYDARDDHTRPLAITYTVTDALPGGTDLTPRYGEDRAHLNGTADYRVFDWIRLGVGGDYLHVSYSPGQIVMSTEETRSWVQATITPLSSVSVTLKGGDGRRDASNFDAAALPAAENPLLWAFDYAPRDRTFFNLSGSWAVTPTLTWALEGSFADDAYRLSQLGLQDGHDRNLSTTLTWAPTETLSVYVNGGYQRMSALQLGDNQSVAPDWDVNDAQHYWTIGTGGHWAVNDRWDFGVDYLRSISGSETDVTAGGPTEAFPENQTQLDSLWVNATYRWTSALRLRLRCGYEKYDSSDWALGGVGVATVPNLLSLGAQPYQHDVASFTLTALYQFGNGGGASK